MAHSSQISFSLITFLSVVIFNAIWVGTIYWLFTSSQLVDIQRNQWNFILQGSAILTLACLWFGQSMANPIIPRTGAVLMIVLCVTALYVIQIAVFRSYFSRTALVIFSFIVIIANFFQAYMMNLRAKPRIGLLSNQGMATLPSDAQNNIELINIKLHPADQWHILVVDFDTDLSPEQQAYVSSAVLAGIPIIRSTLYAEHTTGRIRYENARQIFSVLPGTKVLWSKIKPLFEGVLIITTLPIWLSILLVGCMAVRLDSAGSIFFIQERIGKGGKPFKVFKLRTMKSNDGKAQFAAVDDQRITRIGVYLRKMRIDEIPQFLNVLKGEMALIGPRPEQVNFAQEFSETIPFYALRHSVLPGITGWAQTNSGYASDEISTRKKLEYDLYYIRNQSFALDFYIIIRTLKTILTGFGSR